MIFTRIYNENKEKAAVLHVSCEGVELVEVVEKFKYLGTIFSIALKDSLGTVALLEHSLDVEHTILTEEGWLRWSVVGEGVNTVASWTLPRGIV
jgi:hypothetical protein